MRRLLCLSLLAVAAFAGGTAQAVEGYRVRPDVAAGPDRVGVSAEYSRDNGRSWDPVGGAYVDPQDGEVCAGLGHQIPLCVDAEAAVDLPPVR